MIERAVVSSRPEHVQRQSDLTRVEVNWLSVGWDGKDRNMIWLSLVIRIEMHV